MTLQTPGTLSIYSQGRLRYSRTICGSFSPRAGTYGARALGDLSTGHTGLRGVDDPVFCPLAALADDLGRSRKVGQGVTGGQINEPHRRAFLRSNFELSD